MTDKQQKANIVCCETCSHREVCYDVITNTDYDFKGYGCLQYCVSPLVISNNARKETAKEIFSKLREKSTKSFLDWEGNICHLDEEYVSMREIEAVLKQLGVGEQE